ncbi:hypothetical protein INH39_14775 [Massilia violaceinigra]|uniref:DUF4168 domain-containing protein n=1 Tax=Massilia violaceinigra TaxID=2045208 RepID=A0ABY4ADD3_9BURK|nr:hypothetical protein [Massilia violaceinigra]UOD32807.1 hypothetical protein INH39_14775 [Massilia violaceinigra]
MKGGALLAALVLAAAASLLARPPVPAPAAAAPAAAAPPAGAAAAAAAPGAAQPVQAARPGWFDEVPRAAPAAPVTAADSMADARLHGDARMPPLAPAAAAGAGPSPAQLADPQAYRVYEARQDARVMAAFASAAQREVPRLQADVERARASGIPAAQIARVEEKIRRLEQLRREIAEPGAVPGPGQAP